MNQQKSFVRIALIVLVVILVGVVGYFAFMKKSPEILQTNLPTSTQSTNTNQNSEKISYSGQWVQAQFPQKDYYHSVNIMLPVTWKFNCCGDTDSSSSHFIYPASSENNFETSPYIILYEFALVGCPDGKYLSCSMDELQRVTTNQYVNSLIDHLNKDGEALGLKSLKKTGVLKLSNLSTSAVVYSGVSYSNQPADLYIIQSSKGVVGVVFHQSQSFDSSFQTEFLNRITAN